MGRNMLLAMQMEGVETPGKTKVQILRELCQGSSVTRSNQTAQILQDRVQMEFIGSEPLEPRGKGAAKSSDDGQCSTPHSFLAHPGHSSRVQLFSAPP